MSKDGLLQDRSKRRKYGLVPELRPAKLEDRTAQDRNLLFNTPWVRSDITVSTVAGQVPVAPGRLVSDSVAGGRRTARYVSTAPILAFFSVQSAAYAQKGRRVDGTALRVFYDPQHAFNVDRMLDAMQRSLRYYRANFGPYQFDYARILEYPGYASYAQAFAGTIPYSERIGFIADNRDTAKIDYVSYVTAHELGHQYWGHQLVSADMQGGSMLVETMAQYSALMVMKHQYGDDKIRRFLKYEARQLFAIARRRGRRGSPARSCREPGLYPLSQGVAGDVPAPGSAGRGARQRDAARAARALSVQGQTLSALARSGRRLPVAGTHASGTAAGRRPARPDHRLRPQDHRRRHAQAPGWQLRDRADDPGREGLC
ncbi:hypothetical protein QP162_10305 [Sphingomonas aurantiaca]|uniref:hypothetical protein n=1 Tax=Sphingomonas aurantiaca TaxID=185949 RepID=UPI002FDFC520